MKIVNTTKKTVLCERTEVAMTSIQKTRGLMFRSSLPKKTGFLMTFLGESKTGIWMFGMRFPIDILFIDARKRVVDIIRSARPLTLNPKTWKVFYPKKKAQYILELPAGGSEKTRRGDLVTV